jgi:site-specific DNA recombinase
VWPTPSTAFALAAHDTTGDVDRLRRTDVDADAKISRDGDTLDAGGDPVLIAGWITEATTAKKTAQARRGLTEAPPQCMTGDQPDGIAGRLQRPVCASPGR